MDILYRVFGPPHELLHVLALFLIGRRPKAVSYKHVELPDDLSTRAYVFVAGLPAVVFWSGALVAAIKMVSAGQLGDGLLWFGVFSVAALAGMGTMGDIVLIVQRLRSDRIR